MALQEETMYRHILIATDGSALADKALIHGLAVAKALDAKVTVLTVTEPFHTFAISPEQVTNTAPVYQQHAREHAEHVLNTASEAAKSVGVECRTMHVEHPHPYEAIIKTAGERVCGMIVMASHGRRGASALVLGSETTKVLTHSKIPVLVYR
jgi:nucleotide-binding universal stress UspA family protein